MGPNRPSPKHQPQGSKTRVVRILQPKSATKAARISLILAGAVALTVFVAFRLWQSEAVPNPVQRSLMDIVLEWRCEVGHTFLAQGQLDRQSCPECGRLSYPLARFHCTEHGEVEVAANFTAHEAGPPELSQLRVQGKEWISAHEDLPCPRCGKPLVRAPRDPLAEVQARR